MKVNLAALLLFYILFSGSRLFAQVVVDTLDTDPNLTGAEPRYKNAFMIDGSDNVWIGFRNGLTKWDGSISTFYDHLNSGLPSDNVLSLAFSSQTIWIGTDDGLAKFSGGNWVVYDSLNSGLQSNHINALYADGNNLWIGTNAGAFLFDGTSFTQYSIANSNILKDTIQCIGKTSNAFWFGTNEGLSKFSSGVFTNYDSTNSGLYENYIMKFVTDGNGDLWIQTRVRQYGFYPDYRVYHLNSGNTIVNAAEEFTDCYGNPYNSWLIDTDNNGSIVIAYTAALYETQEIIIHSAQGEKVIKFNEPSGFFESPITILMNKLFAMSSANKIWMVTCMLGGPTQTKIFSMDYSSMVPVMNEDNCYQLQVNKVTARIMNHGTMFYDPAMSGKYEVPANTGKNCIRRSDLWIGCMDSNSTVRTACNLNELYSDYWPGPLDTVDASIDSVTMQQFNKVWKVHRDTIINFIINFQLGNIGNGSYPVADEIANWPANAAGPHGKEQAPYIDNNNDGIYDPYEGDYPDIKGSEMIWWVFNDNFSQHLSSQSPLNMGLEIHATAYALNCQGVAADDSAINYTTFYHYDIYNRSDSNYTNAYAGIYTDVDLGYPYDDHVGCDSVNSFGYAYNGSSNDYGVLGYGENPPMINFALLKGPVAGIADNIDNNHNGSTDEPGEYNMMNSFLYYNNDYDPIDGIPNGAGNFYNYLKATWRNGQHLTYGGDGHGNGQGATSDSTNFMFTGEPYGNGWNETASGFVADDRRFVASSGPFYLPAHGKVSLDFAYVYTRNETGPNGTSTSVATNLHDVMKVKHWFATDSFPCSLGIGINEIARTQNSFSVYPVPANDKVTIQTTTLWKNATVELYDVLGNKISSVPFPSNQLELTVNTDNLVGGLYFVKLFNENNSAVRKVTIR